MTTEAAGATFRPGLAQPPSSGRLKLEHVVMAGAIVAIVVLVVLPVCGTAEGWDGGGRTFGQSERVDRRHRAARARAIQTVGGCSIVRCRARV